MTKFMPNCSIIRDIMAADDEEIETAIDKALQDVYNDFDEERKSQTDARKVLFELSIAKFGSDQIAVSYKVTPKLAPYTCAPKQEKVPDGQTSLFDAEVIDAEVVESTEPYVPSQQAIENEQRYLSLLGGGKKGGRKKKS